MHELAQTITTATNIDWLHCWADQLVPLVPAAYAALCPGVLGTPPAAAEAPGPIMLQE